MQKKLFGSEQEKLGIPAHKKPEKEGEGNGPPVQMNTKAHSPSNKQQTHRKPTTVPPNKIEKLLEKKIVYWRDRLLDLTRRNRLISFKDYKRSNLSLTSPDIRDMLGCLQEGKSIYIHKFEESDKGKEDDQTQLGVGKDRSDDPRNEIGEERSVVPEGLDKNVWVSNYSNKVTEKRLYYLYLKSREILREQGINTLFVALGFLHYFEADHSDEELVAPLVLIPVEIERGRQSSKHRQDYTIKHAGDDTQLNPALMQKLLVDFNLKLPKFTDDADIEKWLSRVRKVIEGKRRWEVSKKSSLGIFSFQKLQIYLDIEKFKDRVLSNPVLQVFVGASSKSVGDFEGLPTGRELDEKIKPPDTFQVLDADSSQQETIEAAKRGASFVIQGPPGTGKSQTIVNMIAELLAQNKRVLFVSEKVAALEVVKKRLDSVGLGQYCLELHSYKANKKAVLQQLEKQLNSRREVTASESEDDFFPLLEMTREELNNLGRALLSPRGNIKFSIYEARGQLATLETTPNISVGIGKPLELAKKVFYQRIARLTTLQGFGDEISRFPEHPWKGITFDQFGLSVSRKLKTTLDKVVETSDEVLKLIDQSQKTMGVSPNSLEELDRLGELLEKVVRKPRTHHVLEPWFLADLRNEMGLMKTIQENLGEIDKSTKYLLEHYQKPYFEIAAGEILERFETEFRLPTRFVKPDYWHTRKVVTSVTKGKRSFSDMRNDLRLLVDTRTLQTKTEKLVGKIKHLAGKNFQGGKTPWNDLVQDIEWAQDIRSSIADVPSKLVDRLVSQDRTLEGVLNQYREVYLGNFRPHIRDLFEYFEDKLKLYKDPVENALIKSLLDWTNELISSFSTLRRWIEFNNLIDNTDLELKQYLTAFLQDIHQPAYIVKCYRKRFLESFLEVAEDEITQISGEYYSNQIEAFRRMDTGQIELAKKRLIENLEKNKPTLGVFTNTSSSELAVLKKEVLKKRRHKPLRTLFAEIPNLLFTLKPCFMMSPLSVCRYIDLEKIEPFDVVIFDEASQVMTEDAVSSLIRAKQVIIVGDSQQLPPTRFFSRIHDDGFEIEEDLEDLESILDNATPRLQEKRLRWHYRSKDETLIAFSNKNFYDGRLITFPHSEKTSERGVEFVHVKDGVYDRGGTRTNFKEAKRVAQLVKEHIKRSPRKSLGVVAFSIPQQQAIRDQIEILRRQHPEYSEFFEESVLDEFFVKNLESVQGDERDVMIFSVGYGPDTARKISLNFGPINKTGGYRRLNVAITRAREKIYLVASFQPETIDLTRTSNPGVRYLIKYMKYAKGLVEPEVTVTETLALESPFEEAVYNKLTARGWDIATQVGCSGYRIDLAIKHPQKKGLFVLGIECDGSSYHSPITARDRDRLRQGVLENLGWEIHRIWSTDWMLDSDREVRKIEDRLSEILKGDGQRHQTDSPNQVVVEERVLDNTKSLKLSKYQPAELKQHVGGAKAFDRAYSSTIGKEIIQVVEQESPVHIDLVLQRVREAWGIARVGTRIEKRLISEIKSFVLSGDIQRDGDILWRGKKRALPRVRIARKEDRPVSLIPLPELATLAKRLLENGFSIDREDLVVEMARVLGYARTGQTIQKHFRKAIKYLESLGRVQVVGGRVELVNS